MLTTYYSFTSLFHHYDALCVTNLTNNEFMAKQTLKQFGPCNAIWCELHITKPDITKYDIKRSIT